MLKEFLTQTLRPHQFRGKARLLDALSVHDGEAEADVFGYRVLLDRSDFIQRRIYLNAYEPHESRLVRGYLKPGMTFVDVGANIGYFTFLAASIVGPTGCVISLEPSPYAADRLSETVSRNKIDQVRIFPVGIAEHPGELSLYLPKVAGNHTPTMIPNLGGDAFAVPVRRLDECLREAGVEHVDILKIDVEGFEPSVLKSVDTYFKKQQIDAVLCEFNRYWLEQNHSSPEELYEFIESFGFQSRGGRADLQGGEENLLLLKAKR